MSSEPAPAAEAGRRWRLVRRRTCWWPTPLGWLVLLVLAAALSVVAVRSVYPFLAPTESFATGPVVVEGWMGEETLTAAIGEFRRHGEPKLFLLGGPLSGELLATGFADYAELGTFLLERAGLERSAIEAIPVPLVRRDRTYTSALTLKQWFQAHGGLPPQLTLISVGPHSRRSRMLYQRAFGPGTRIGIIAFEENSYDAMHWWNSSAGFRMVVDESIAYLYARLLFWRFDP